MKIIILGAGQVGSSLAESLVNESEHNEITVVDADATRLRNLRDRLDLNTVEGNAASPTILQAAGAEDADMLVAVTNSDEINMIACQVAYLLYNTPTRLARVRSLDYLQHEALFAEGGIPVNVKISPEQLVTRYVQRLIEYPGALQVVDFAGGKVQLVAVRAYADGPLVGHEVARLKEQLPEGVESRIAVIFREGKAIFPTGKTIIRVNDTVYFLAARKDIPHVMRALRKVDNPARRVILAGGGNIGRSLAQVLEKEHYVKIIEQDGSRARRIAQDLEKAIVLQGDCADEELLLDENIDQTDVFCAITNDDEANILSAMLAKRLGARRVISLINRPSYVDLVEGGLVDIAISPQQITLGALLRHLRRGEVAQLHSLRRGHAEAMETVATGTESTSKVIGRALEEIELPEGVTIGGLVRGQQVKMAHHDLVIEADDHVLLFIADKKQVPEVEKLFQPGATFF